MARPESVAVAGFYKTPTHLVPQIARLIRAGSTAEGEIVFVDPCAGEGEAITILRDEVLRHLDTPSDIRASSRLYACEMEATRHDALSRRQSAAWGGWGSPPEGDAFLVDFVVDDGASILFLNPPYDLDPEHGRLEQRFLARFGVALAPGGVLVLVVPFYALRASANLLARDFTDLHCFRFPGADFDAFQQVVLVATRAPSLLTRDERIFAQVAAWSASAAEIPELGTETGPVATAPSVRSAFVRWEIAELDLAGLRRRARAWHTTDRAGRLAPILGTLPLESASELLSRRYPVAMPPRPAHIAAGIASGVFNGARVEPDDPRSGLPSLLVKGSFDREFVAIDEKTNKEGEVVGQIEVQQPRLVVTVLDLRSRRYVTLRSSTETTGARDVASMTTADLIASYGRALMARMVEQCPVLHDPARADAQLELPELARPLYRAQAQAVMATVKLLGGAHATRAARRGTAAFVLGEIGAGKTSVALATAKTIGARRVLAMVPPHLLDGWRDQAAAVLPDARVEVLSDVDGVERFAASTSSQLTIGIVSREAAKLGHAWASVGPLCPDCGAPVPGGDLARSRARCDARRSMPASQSARLAEKLAIELLPWAPKDPSIAALLSGRIAQRLHAKVGASEAREGWKPSPAIVRAVRSYVSGTFRAESFDGARADAALELLSAVGDSDTIEALSRAAWESGATDLSTYNQGEARRKFAVRIGLLLPVDSAAQRRLTIALAALPQADDRYGRSMSLETAVTAAFDNALPWDLKAHALVDGAVAFNKNRPRTIDAACSALRALAARGKWTVAKPCGAALFCALPDPRRVPLATYIARRHPHLFDLLILDEGHEYSGDGSAQGFAAHRLTSLGLPTLLLTGSVMNGYADSLFANQWALDPDFRAEFGRDERAEFVRRYGYVKQLVEQRDSKGKVVAFGSHTDRVERSARTIGHAPGVLPLFVLRFLLRRAVTLHKTDLALDLPRCDERTVSIEPTEALAAAFKRLQTKLVTQIKRDMFSDRAGKLWGQMAELPSFLDRSTADVCGDAFTVAYPESIGGEVVVAEPARPSSEISPKEQWMIDTVRTELAEGRRVMVLAWHVALLPRLSRLLEQALGEKCPVLHADKVTAAKRQGWIDREIIAKGRRVLVVNPVAVQTGLNNLVWFSTQLWMQNPGVNAIGYRQTVGRVDRIGQRQETRIFFPVYAGTPQETLHSLLLHKVAVSMSTDGLDAESALAAAGVGDARGLEAIAVGRQLYELALASSTEARAA